MDTQTLNQKEHIHFHLLPIFDRVTESFDKLNNTDNIKYHGEIPYSMM